MEWRAVRTETGFATLTLPFRAVGYLALLAGIVLPLDYCRYLWADGIPAALANKDFANYWASAHLAADGRSAVIFGPNPPYIAHLRSVFGADFAWHIWSYPPNYLLLMMPLALIGYKAGLVLFIGATGLLFALGLRAVVGRRLTALDIVAVAPATVLNIWAAQNGFLTGGLILLSLGWRDRRPLPAGICLGLLSVKPQLALLLPIIFLVERRWAALAAAAITALLLAAASIAAFGIAPWAGYFDTVVPYNGQVTMAGGGFFLTMMPSIFGGLRLIGMEGAAALSVHLAVTAIVVPAAVAGILLIDDGRRRVALAMTATFLITPYSFGYDMGVSGAAIALFVATETESGRTFSASRQLWLATAIALPLLMVPFGLAGLPIAPFVLSTIFLLMLARGQVLQALTDKLPRWNLGRR